jgi:hypothetical protein
MEMAFNRFRMASKFPPTVAEMAEELANVHYQALEGAMEAHSIGDNESINLYSKIMSITEPYKSGSYKDTPMVDLRRMLASCSLAGVLSDGQDA